MHNNINNINNINNMNSANSINSTEDFMYPEVYHKFMPIIDQIIKEMERQHGNIYLSEDLLHQMSDEVIRRSGMGMGTGIDMPQPIQQKDNAIPAMAGYEHHEHHGHDEHWRRYDRGALSDITSILLLQQLFGRRRPSWRFR